MKVVVSVAGERIGIASLVSPGEYCVGRTEGSSLHLQHPTVSRRHARLLWDGGALRLLDETGGARTWLNGRPVGRQEVWRKGEQLRLGAVALDLVEDESLCAVALQPGGWSGALSSDEPPTATFGRLAPPESRPVWARATAVVAASAAAIASAWVALFW